MDKSINRKNPVAKISENTIILFNFISNCEVGEELSFAKIEHETKVKMDNKGKQNLRSAINKAKLVYSSIIGYGIKLADKDVAMPILGTQLTKIDRTVKKGAKTHKRLMEQFFEELPEAEQKQFLFIGAAFGAIRVASENGRLVYESKNKMLNANVLNVPLPKY